MTLTSTKSLPDNKIFKQTKECWHDPNDQEPSWRRGGERKRESSQDSKKRRSQAGDQLTMMVILSIRSLIPLIHDDFLVFDFQS